MFAASQSKACASEMKLVTFSSSIALKRSMCGAKAEGLRMEDVSAARGRAHNGKTVNPTKIAKTRNANHAAPFESQGDSVTKPRVARNELPWVTGLDSFQP